MRGTRAKRIRQSLAFSLAQRNLSATPTYMEMPGTAVQYTRPALDAEGKPMLDANGKPISIPTYRTVTTQLAPECLRYYTQKAKRQLQRGARV
jgi:hypothetical protein